MRSPHPTCSKEPEINRDRRRLIGIAGAVLAATLVAAQAGQRILLTDKDGSVEITNYSGFNIRVLGEGRTRIIATGKPLKLTWSKERMTLRSPRFEGILVQNAGRGLDLQTATLAAELEMDLLRKSNNPSANQDQVMHLESGESVYTAADRKVTLSGRVLLTRNDPGARQTMSIKGSSGAVTFHPSPIPAAARSALSTARIQGPVTLNMTSVRQIEGKDTPTRVDATGQTLTYDDAAGTIVLTGNVRVVGNDPALFGDITASRVTFKLNAQGHIEEIDVVGAPSTIDLRKPPTRR